MDIAITHYDDGNKWVRIYRNIDPHSFIVQKGRLYFAHEGCWLSEIAANRYQVNIAEMAYMTADPQEVERLKQSIAPHDYAIAREEKEHGN